MNKHFKHLPFNELPFIWSDFIELYTLSIPGGHCNEELFIKFIQKHSPEKDASSTENTKALWAQIVHHCFERTSLYAGHYPFEIEKKQKSINLKFIRTHPKQRLYLSMVIAAMIRYLPKEWYTHIAEDFSTTCKEIFASLMPEGTQLERITVPSTTLLTLEQIQNLIHLACGGDLNGKNQPLDLSSLSALSSTNKNEKNTSLLVNMLAWHPIGNNHDGIPIAVARFDCGIENWQRGQQHLSTLDEQIYAQRTPWAAYHFSPIDLYTAKQDWKVQQIPGRMILLDRYRILALAEKYFIYNKVPDISHIELLYQHIKEPD